MGMLLCLLLQLIDLESQSIVLNYDFDHLGLIGDIDTDISRKGMLGCIGESFLNQSEYRRFHG
ncbi:hypothetical protein D1872_327850 [compost metagenome]